MSIKSHISGLAGRLVDKALSLSTYARLWLGGGDPQSESDSKATAPYKQVSLVFTCVNKLISSVQGLPLMLSTINEDIVESGAAYDLLFNNPAMNYEDFIRDTVGFYALYSDVFWVFLDSEKGKEIRVVCGRQMYPITHNRLPNGELIGWEFRGLHGEKQNFTLDEVHQIKNFNPYDKFHGLGPVDAAKVNIDYTFASALYNANVLANGAEPGTIISLQGKPSDGEIRMLREQFDARHRGAAKAKRTAIITGGADLKTVAMKMADMEVAQITELSDKKICSAFGVPPGVVGLITEAQYSQGPAQRDFIFNTVIPFTRLLAGHITSSILTRAPKSKWLGGGFETVSAAKLSNNKFYHYHSRKAKDTKAQLFAWFDSAQHPSVQEYDREVAEKALKFVDAGVPLNDIIEAYDLPFPLTEAGKHRWVGMGQVPADYILQAGLEGITGPSLPEGESDASEEPEKSAAVKSVTSVAKDEQQRARIWRGWVTSWLGIEREYQSTIRLFFVKQQREIIKKLKDVIGDSKSAIGEIRATSDEIVARVVFDIRKENNKIRVINQTFFAKASELGIRQSLTEVLGAKKDELKKLTDQTLLNPALKKKMEISTSKITEVNKVTQQLIANQLRQGLESGEGLNQLTNRLKDSFGFALKRAQRIARTQTAGAVDSGRHFGMKTAGVERKGWLTSRDEVVRDAHKEAESRYAAGIPLDEPFSVGGEDLMYPADPAGSAANIINCRCLQIALAAAGKSFDISHYRKFYTYSDMQEDLKNGTEN
ncbi:MAG: phage portal protein [Candidatus Marinimicrobia bacterium]|jgi:HK97 family phage portal protein|nr:phage portal protein [Candidatus Neomarinimicrobiota bacterium]